MGNTRIAPNSLGEDLLSPTPDFEIDRNGNRIDLSGPVWRILDPSIHERGIHWENMPDGAIKQALRLYIVHTLRSDATITCHDKAREIRQALNHSKFPNSLNEIDLRWWNSLRQWYRGKGLEEKIHYARDWYLWMVDNGFPGVDMDIAITIDDWSVRRRSRGALVTRLDKDMGPLSERQFATLELVLNRDQPVTLGQAATIICKELGARTLAITLLQERDLHTFADPESPTLAVFQLDLPRVKKGLVKRETKRRPISAHAGSVLMGLIAANRQRFGSTEPMRPLLCRAEPQQLAAVNANESLNAYRCNDNDIRKTVSAYWESQSLCVSATRVDFSIHPRRLRYTFGCRLASIGATAIEIAEALDHEDLQNVNAYVEMRGDMAIRLSSALASRVGPLVDKFLGRTASRDLAAEGHATLIPGRTFQGQLLGCIGVCASPRACKLQPPLTCYDCDDYDPFNDLDTPHEKMLESASQYRERYLAYDNATRAGLEKVETVILNIQACIEAKRRLAGVKRSKDDQCVHVIDIDDDNKVEQNTHG